MSAFWRWMLALSIILVDLVAFAVPLGAVFLAYVILINPPWFREFLEKMDQKAE